MESAVGSPIGTLRSALNSLRPDNPTLANAFTDDDLQKLLAGGYKSLWDLRNARRESLHALDLPPARIDNLMLDQTVPEERREFEVIGMPALDLEEDDFQNKMWDLIKPAEERRRAGPQSPASSEPSTPPQPQHPSQAEPARYLGSKHLYTFMETSDPQQALKTTPTSTPSSRKPSAEEPRELSPVKSMAKLSVDMAPSPNDSLVSLGQASAGSTNPPEDDSHRLAQDGICPLWYHNIGSCDERCQLNHCRLDDPGFDHAKGTGRRAQLCTLVSELSGLQPLELGTPKEHRQDLPFTGRMNIMPRLGSMMGKAIKATYANKPTREEAVLINIIDGAGVGKTRILEEIQACADMPSWHSLPKLGLGTEARQVFKDGLALFPISTLSYNRASLQRKDAEINSPAMSLGVRLASSVFQITDSVSTLLSTLPPEKLRLFELENLLPIIGTALRRRAEATGRCRCAAGRVVLLGIQLDELQSALENLQAAGMPPDAAAKFGRDMCHEVGELVALGIAKKYGIALMLIGAGTRAPHDNIFVPTFFKTVQLHVGPLTLLETLAVMVGALHQGAWGKYKRLKHLTEEDVRILLSHKSLLASLAELSGIPRAMQWAYSVLGEEENMAHVANQYRGFDTPVASSVRAKITSEMELYKGTALRKIRKEALKEILLLVISGTPVSCEHRLVGPRGPSIHECLESGLLYVDSTAARMVLRLPKQLIVDLYSRTGLKTTYGQLDHGYDELKGKPFEDLCSGILRLRCCLFTSLGVEACPLAALLPGALGNAGLLKKEVKVKAMTKDQDAELFMDARKRLMYTQQRNLTKQKAFQEASGYVQIRCDLPATAAGHKACALIDYRATLHPADGGKPLMLIQQVKGKTGKEGKGYLQQQGLEQWLKPLEEALQPLEEEFEVVFVYLTQQLLGKEGWLYTAAKHNLLVVPRQTMPVYLPVIQDRLAVLDLQLPLAEDED